MTRFRSLRALALLLAAAAVTAVATGTAVTAEPVFPRGSRIGLEPPPGMVASNRFAGFEDAERQAAILMLDLPAAAYQQMEGTLFDKPQKDVSDFTRRSLAFNGGDGMLATGNVSKNDKTMHKWFFLAKGGGAMPDLTAFVTVEVPEAARAVYTDAVIEKALESLTFRKTPIAEQLAMLPFTLNDLAGFHVRQVAPTGSVILTEKEEGGLFEGAYVVVSVAPGGPTGADDRTRFARDLMTNAPVRDLAITFGDTIRIKSMPASEIRATGKDASDKPISLVQWLRFGSGAFMRIVAVAPKAEWDAMFPRFRALRDGIDSK
jgi:hypothetical protein